MIVDFNFSKYKIWVRDFNKDIFFPHPNLINLDSKNIKPGDWFLAMNGKNINSHIFINDVLENGAAGFLYEKKYINYIKKKNLIKGLAVENSLKALHQITKIWRDNFSIPVIAITGSVGKTTTRNILHNILNLAHRDLTAFKNYNNEIGVPLTILRLNDNYNSVTLEFGARNTGDIQLLTNMAKPNISVLTNIGHVHIESFRSYENIAKEKLNIFCNSTKIAVLPDKINIKNNKDIIKFGFSNLADARIVNYKIFKNNMFIKLEIFGEKFEFRFPKIHNSYPINIAPSVAIALRLGIDKEIIIKSLENYTGLKSRFDISNIKNNIILIDDSYNSSFISILSAFKTIKIYDRKKILILSDMLELGKHSKSLHRDIGIACQNYIKNYKLILVGQYVKYITEGVLEYGGNIKNIFYFKDLESLKENVISFIEKDILIYVKGSNAMNLNKIVDLIKKN